MRWVEVGDDGKSGLCHLARFDEATAAHEVLLAPVAPFAAWRKTLERLPVVDALHGAVNPPETQGHLDGIDVTDNARTIRFGTIDAQPKVGGLVVFLGVPLV